MPVTFKYQKSDVFDALTSGEDKIFESNIQLLVFAASVGFEQNKQVHSPELSGEIRWSYLSQNTPLSITTAALAYADHNDPDVILDPESQIETLQTYGAGGAEILQEAIIDQSGSNLDNLIMFLKDHQNDKNIERQAGILEEMQEEISSIKTTNNKHTS